MISRSPPTNFKEGLRIWKIVMEDYPTYRDDELCKKDTGQIVKRYVRVLTAESHADTG